MNGYWIFALLLSFVSWSGFMYYEGGSKETAICGQEDAKEQVKAQQGTITAQKGVIASVGQQQTITSEVDNAYQSKKSDIDSQYVDSFVGVRTAGAPTTGCLFAAGSASGRPDAATPQPLHTTVFKLNAKECDENTEQLIGLQAWVKGQLTVKPPGAPAH